ncbi:hypothetical protein K439DRAFT_1612179 [Ramaria rubella]|nr:hypothetical protein K439DRAFT_1612179 [Ramaria rubella]
MFQLRCRLGRNFGHDDDDPAFFSGDRAVDGEGTTLDIDEDIDDNEVGLDVNGEAVDEMAGGSEGTLMSIVENGVASVALDCHNKPAASHWKLCVACCGMILSRAMFYGAEGPRSVVLTVLIGILEASLPNQGVSA